MRYRNDLWSLTSNYFYFLQRYQAKTSNQITNEQLNRLLDFIPNNYDNKSNNNCYTGASKNIKTDANQKSKHNVKSIANKPLNDNNTSKDCNNNNHMHQFYKIPESVISNHICNDIFKCVFIICNL